MTIHDQRIVILGGSAGIGLAVARQAAAAGARVVIASSTQARVTAALASLPPGAEGHTVDLRSADAIGGLFDRLGAFDHLVYTAGDPLTIGPLATLDLAAARRAFEVRYWGAVAAVKHAAPRLRAGGSITLCSGTAARKPHPGWTVGASICSAMEGLTRALAVELAPLRVNIVTPGLVDTELWTPMEAGARDQLFSGAAASLPTRRVGQPDDIAAIYLALIANPYITGQAVVVDGGGVLV